MLTRQFKRLGLMAFVVVTATLAFAGVRLSSGSERTLLVEESSRLFGGSGVTGGGGGLSGVDCGNNVFCTGLNRICETLDRPNCQGGPVGYYPVNTANTMACNVPATVEVNCTQGPNAVCLNQYFCSWDAKANACVKNAVIKTQVDNPTFCGTYLQVP